MLFSILYLVEKLIQVNKRIFIRKGAVVPTHKPKKKIITNDLYETFFYNFKKKYSI